MKQTVLFLIVTAILVFPAVSALPAGFEETTFVALGQSSPTAMAFAPDGRLFIAQQNGRVQIVENGVLLAQPFVQVPADPFGERGLLGITFHPQYPQQPYVYLYYTDMASDTNKVTRWTTNSSNPNQALPGSEVVLLDLAASVEGWHNGGALHFGTDGKLYIGTGDGHETANSQNLSSLSGKLLRINDDGSIPSDNPFINTSGARGEIYAYGLRNPFTFAVDEVTDVIYINDVGNGLFEEINELAAGANYGWPACEGACSTPGMTNPVYQYALGSGPCAITGGTFAATAAFPSQYLDDYYFADFCADFIATLQPNYAREDFITPTMHSNVVDLDISPEGDFYYLARGALFNGNASVGKIAYIGAGNRVPIAQLTATPTEGLPPLAVLFNASASFDPDDDALTYTWDFGDNTTGSGVTAQHTYTTSGQYTATLTVTDTQNASSTATATIRVGTPPAAQIVLSDTLYRGGDTISFSGTATDAEDGALGASAFSWTILFHHNNHTHPFIGPITNTTGSSFIVATANHEMSTNVWYRIYLTVTDSSGVSTTVTRDVQPVVANVTLTTIPADLQLTLDGSPTLDETIPMIVGMQRTISATLQQALQGIIYDFVSWSDGGAATHTIIVPENGATYTATYEAAAQGSDPNWWNSSFRHRINITMNNTATQPLTNFPVLVTLHSNRISYALTKDAGEDLRFVDADGAVLAHEIEYWNKSGTSYVWVSVPQINASSATDHFYLYYDNPAATDAQNAAAIWSEYDIVSHLADTTTNGTFKDSTGKGNSGTGAGGLVTSTLASGAAGRAVTFDGGDDLIRYPNIDYTSSPATIEIWARLPDTTGWHDLVSTGPSFFPPHRLSTNGNSISTTFDNVQLNLFNTLQANNWYYMVLTANATHYQVYRNGQLVGTQTHDNSFVVTPQPWAIGSDPNDQWNLLGDLDEFRLGRVHRSTAWITAQHRAVTDQLLGYGAQESMPNPDVTPPTVPQNLVASALAHDSVSLQWSQSIDDVAVAGYFVYRDGALLHMVTGTTYVDSEVSAETSYTYAVAAYDTSNLVSAQSTASIVTTPQAPDTEAPSVPQNVVATNVTVTAVMLSWEPSSDNQGVAGYSVYRDGEVVANVTSTEYTDAELSELTNYTYVVAAFDASGLLSNTSDPLTVSTLLSPDVLPPSAPANLNATNITHNSFVLVWGASTDNRGVVGYTVYRDGAALANTSMLSYADSGLSEETSYNYAVAAFDGAGLSTVSGVLQVTTTQAPDITPPSTPGNLLGTANSAGVSLTWDASTDNVGVAGYFVTRNGAPLANVSALSFVDSAIAPATAYLYAVVAYDAAGLQSAAAELNISTPAVPVLTTIIVEPANATVSASNSLQFTAQTLDQYGQPIAANLSWSMSGGATMSSSGLFSAANQYVVVAQSGAVQGNTTVAVS